MDDQTRRFRILDRHKNPVKREDYQRVQLAHYREEVSTCPVGDNETKFIYPYAGEVRILEGEPARVELTEFEDELELNVLMTIHARVNSRFRIKDMGDAE
jgi:hypothetical protein